MRIWSPWRIRRRRSRCWRRSSLASSSSRRLGLWSGRGCCAKTPSSGPSSSPSRGPLSSPSRGPSSLRDFSAYAILSLYLRFLTQFYVIPSKSTTDKAYLQDEEDPKSMAPPLQPKPLGRLGLFFLLGVNQTHRIGVTIAIFEFPPQTSKNGLPMGLGRRPPRPQKWQKIFFRIFHFFRLEHEKGC